MPFQKGNKFGARKIEAEPLDTEPICFKGRQGQKEKLKAIHNWQVKLRDYIHTLISNSAN